MSKLAIITATAGADSLSDAVTSWGFNFTVRGQSAYVTPPWPESPVLLVDGHAGMLSAYQLGFEIASEEGCDILAFLHDDLLLMDPNWIQRVLAEFEDPKVGLVGFGGSPTHGSRDLYRCPYQIKQLSRGKFFSNLLDAEVHGYRTEEPMEVATLDGFALIFRRTVLEKAGGWPVKELQFHGYDFWATCMTHRLGYRVRLVPIQCLHLGGRTSVQKDMDPAGSHEAGHRWIYSHFQDQIPFSCV